MCNIVCCKIHREKNEGVFAFCLKNLDKQLVKWASHFFRWWAEWREENWNSRESEALARQIAWHCSNFPSRHVLLRFRKENIHQWFEIYVNSTVPKSRLGPFPTFGREMFHFWPKFSVVWANCRVACQRNLMSDPSTKEKFPFRNNVCFHQGMCSVFSPMQSCVI